MYDKIDRNHALRIETIKQGLWKPEKKKQQIELDEEQKKNPYQTLLIWNIKRDELKPGHLQMKKGWILSYVVKYVHYNLLIIMN